MIPSHMTEYLCNYAVIRDGVDGNHVVNIANRRFCSCIIVDVNNAPIIWYSKFQNTVEASSIGSEFVILMIAIEIIEAPKYKLRCFGVTVDGITEVFCDNTSVVKNSIIPTSYLYKIHNDIYYHRVRGDQT